jgi:hypothetical protein
MINKRIIIVGGGSSVRQNQWDSPINTLKLWNYLEKEPTVALNYVFRYFNNTFTCFHDEAFYRSNLEELKNLPLIIGRYANNNLPILLPNTYLVKSVTTHLDNQWENGFYGSSLVGILALSICINLGYKEIYLLGYDFGSIDGQRTHFYQDSVDISEKGCDKRPKYRGFGWKNDGKGNKTYNCANYQNASIKYFEPFLNYLDKIKIINVGLQSHINEFPKISYDEFYNILENNPQNINQTEERKEIENIILTNIGKK